MAREHRRFGASVMKSHYGVSLMERRHGGTTATRACDLSDKDTLYKSDNGKEHLERQTRYISGRRLVPP